MREHGGVELIGGSTAAVRRFARASGSLILTLMHDESMSHRLAGLLRGGAEEIAAAYLFGSFARGDARDGSDVDVGLLYHVEPRRAIDASPYEVEGRLERALGRSVQVVVLNSAPPDLVHRVLRDGILVQESDRSARIRFEVAARNAYFDLLPVLRRYRRSRAS